MSYVLASHQLIDHIEQFLDTNETLYFMKSMDCIKAFREEAIQFSEEQRFNNFLKALREKVEIKQLNHFFKPVFPVFSACFVLEWWFSMNDDFDPFILGTSMGTFGRVVSIGI